MIKFENFHSDVNGNGGIGPINLEIRQGDIVAVIGRSGIGKTTLLRNIMMRSGELLSDKTRREKSSLIVSYLPQRPHLYSNITAQKFIDEVLRHQNSGEIDWLISHFQFQGKLGRKIHQLSGGELQRLLLICLIFRGSDLLLLDEPFAPLDYFLRVRLVELMNKKQTYSCVGSTIIVTHDVELALDCADKIICVRSKKNASEIKIIPNLIGNSMVEKTKMVKSILDYAFS